MIQALVLDIREAEAIYMADPAATEWEDDGTVFGHPVYAVGDRWRRLLIAWAKANGYGLEVWARNGQTRELV